MVINIVGKQFLLRITPEENDAMCGRSRGSGYVQEAVVPDPMLTYAEKNRLMGYNQ
jgi:hypothetical protein